jgi:hypothetical protein
LCLAGADGPFVVIAPAVIVRSDSDAAILFIPLLGIASSLALLAMTAGAMTTGAMTTGAMTTGLMPVGHPYSANCWSGGCQPHGVDRNLLQDLQPMLAAEPSVQGLTEDGIEPPCITVDIASGNPHFDLRYCINAASLCLVACERQGTNLDQ